MSINIIIIKPNTYFDTNGFNSLDLNKYNILNDIIDEYSIMFNVKKTSLILIYNGKILDLNNKVKQYKDKYLILVILKNTTTSINISKFFHSFIPENIFNLNEIQVNDNEINEIEMEIDNEINEIEMEMEMEMDNEMEIDNEINEMEIDNEMEMDNEMNNEINEMEMDNEINTTILDEVVKDKMDILNKMGFSNIEKNREALIVCEYDINKAVKYLLEI